MTLPPALKETLAELLGGPVDEARAVFGGDINQSGRFTCRGTPYFVKWNAHAPEGMFAAESHGLRLLAGAQAVRVPAVIAHGEGGGGCPAYLVMEWIDTGERRPGTMAEFGRGLAALHRHTHATHGLDRDNFIGRLPQANPPTAGWTAFYRDHRIGAQMALARRLGRLPARREDLLTRLMDRLPGLLDDDAMPPALLHGDLWGGNYLVDNQGHAVLIDPAVYYGHREMDLAMSELFGGFAPDFYAAYREAYPPDGYDERRALYQLYYILVHLNLFGESYGGRVDSLAGRYVGR